MPGSKETEKPLADEILDWAGKAADRVTFAQPAVQAFAGTSVARALHVVEESAELAKGLHVADGVLGFLIGPLSAAIDATDSSKDTAFRVASAIQVPLSIAAKYETTHGLIAGTFFEASGSVNLTFGGFFTTPGQMAAVIASFKVGYQAGHFLDEHAHLSDRISNFAVGLTHADHIDPESYPFATIYDYLQANLPMPPDIREKVEQGLADHGATWPQFSQYPPYLQHELTDRAAETLGGLAHLVTGLAHGMDSWVILDPHLFAPPDSHSGGRDGDGRHDVPPAHPAAEPNSPHGEQAQPSQPVQPDSPTRAPAGQHEPAATPAGHTPGLPDGTGVALPVYGPPAPGPEPQPGQADAALSQTAPVSPNPGTLGDGAGHASAPHVEQANFVGLADDHLAIYGALGDPAADSPYLGVGLADDHLPGAADYSAGLGDDSYVADIDHGFDYGSADDGAQS